MTQPPQTCHVDTDLVMASRRMKETGCGTLAVIDHRGRVAGIVTDRDLALALADTRREASRIAVDKAMTHRVHACRPEDDLHVALGLMASAKVRRLPVISGEGDLKGVISIDDIILWGVHHSGVSMHDLTDALRSICARQTVALEADGADC
jgi:CBS domain-containing protein